MKAVTYSQESTPLPPQIQAILETTPLVEAEEFPQWRTELSMQGFGGTEIATILSQWELRKQGLKKFGGAARNMIFTRTGLEQASQLEVANYHAQIFHEAGVDSIADLGCGLGADALAFARVGAAVQAVEIDTQTAFYAAFNLRGYPQSQVLLGSAQEYLQTKKPTAIFADPARRNQSGRVLNPQQWSPPLAEIIGWRNRSKYMGIKIAPGIKYEALPPRFHARWVAVGDNLVEATLWSDSLLPPGRSAMIIHPDRSETTVIVPDITNPGQPPATVCTTQLGQYLFEANPALLRAGGLGYLAENLNAGLISPGISYLTANSLPNAGMQPWLKAYEILQILPLRVKPIAQELAKLGATRIDIKKRGWEGDPTQFRKKLLQSLPKGKTTAKTVTLVLSQVEGKHCCLLVAPLTK